MSCYSTYNPQCQVVLLFSYFFSSFLGAKIQELYWIFKHIFVLSRKWTYRLFKGFQAVRFSQAYLRYQNFQTWLTLAQCSFSFKDRKKKELYRIYPNWHLCQKFIQIMMSERLRSRCGPTRAFHSST